MNIIVSFVIERINYILLQNKEGKYVLFSLVKNGEKFVVTEINKEHYEKIQNALKTLFKENADLNSINIVDAPVFNLSEENYKYGQNINLNEMCERNMKNNLSVFNEDKSSSNIFSIISKIIIPLVTIVVIIGITMIGTKFINFASISKDNNVEDEMFFVEDLEESKYLLVSKLKGKITEPIFDYAGYFSGGSALVVGLDNKQTDKYGRVDGDRKYGIIDEEGKMIVEYYKYDDITRIGGLYLTYNEEKDEYKMLNSKGEYFTVEKEAIPFTVNKSTVLLYSESEQKYYIYNEKGEIISTGNSDVAPLVNYSYLDDIGVIITSNNVYLYVEDEIYEGTMESDLNTMASPNFYFQNNGVIIETLTKLSEDTMSFEMSAYYQFLDGELINEKNDDCTSLKIEDEYYICENEEDMEIRINNGDVYPYYRDTDPYYEDVNYFSDANYIKEGENNEVIYFSNTGDILKTYPGYKFKALEFKNNVSFIYKYPNDGEQMEWLLISSVGEVINKYDFEQSSDSWIDSQIIVKKDEKYQFLDTSGNLSEKKYDSIKALTTYPSSPEEPINSADFANPLFLYLVEDDGIFNLINSKEKIIIPGLGNVAYITEKGKIPAIITFDLPPLDIFSSSSNSSYELSAYNLEGEKLFTEKCSNTYEEQDYFMCFLENTWKYYTYDGYLLYEKKYK